MGCQGAVTFQVHKALAATCWCYDVLGPAFMKAGLAFVYVAKSERADFALFWDATVCPVALSFCKTTYRSRHYITSEAVRSTGRIVACVVSLG